MRVATVLVKVIWDDRAKVWIVESAWVSPRGQKMSKRTVKSTGPMDGHIFREITESVADVVRRTEPLF